MNCESNLSTHHKSTFVFAALLSLSSLCTMWTTAGLTAEPAEKITDLECPKVALSSSVQIVEIASSGQGAEGPWSIVPPLMTYRCSDLCDMPAILKSVTIKVPGDVFLVLVGSGDLRWKPVAAAGTRIMGVLTLSSRSARVYRTPGILSETQLTPVARLSSHDLTTACKLKTSDYANHDDGLSLQSRIWTKDAVRAVIGREPDEVLLD
jgi:hypothetical protein